VPLRKARIAALAGDLLELEPGEVVGEPHEGHIAGSLTQAGRLAAPVEALGLDPHARVLAREPRTSESGELAGARGLEPDPEPSDLAATGALRTVDGLVEMNEHLTSIREQNLAGGRELHPAAVAAQKPGADLPLQAADRLAHRRLREGEILGGAAEAQPLRDRHEVTKLAALGHSARLPPAPRPNAESADAIADRDRLTGHPSVTVRKRAVQPGTCLPATRRLPGTTRRDRAMPDGGQWDS
jgi:hypothetical protein